MTLRNTLRDRIGLAFAMTPGFRGKTRIARVIDRLTLPSASDEVVTRNGVRWNLDTREMIQFAIFYHGAYGANVIAGLTSLLQEASVAKPILWDIGGNIGAVSFALAARFPGVEVHAFEPSLAAGRRFARHLALNPNLAPRVHLHALALSNTDGEVAFHESREAGNLGVGSLVPMHNTEVQARQIACRRGEALVADGRVPPPSLIKLDVEGWELEVLEGLRAVLVAHHPSVVMEYEAYRQGPRGRSLGQLLGWFRECGYTRFEQLAADGSRAPLRSDDPSSHLDFIASRPSTP